MTTRGTPYDGCAIPYHECYVACTTSGHVPPHECLRTYSYIVGLRNIQVYPTMIVLSPLACVTSSACDRLVEPGGQRGTDDPTCCSVFSRHVTREDACVGVPGEISETYRIKGLTARHVAYTHTQAPPPGAPSRPERLGSRARAA